MSVSGRPCAHGRHGNSHHHRTTPALQEEEKPAEKEAFDLKLVSFDDKSKIKVIKEVRTISGLGLKEVRCLVSSVRCFFVFTRRSPRDLVRVRACVYMDGWRDVGGWVGRYHFRAGAQAGGGLCVYMDGWMEGCGWVGRYGWREGGREHVGGLPVHMRSSKSSPIHPVSSHHTPRIHPSIQRPQAKELVEGAPKIIKKEVKKEEAQKLLEKLKEVGAKVELV